ncbi:F0F1 ATP synthase subunit A [Blattabacterium cuenoti]|uniref:ATP synthase subunit a n=1 Tax=Blattabacterium sp. (Chorisoserrata sp.) TaxID=2712796 RepID=A0A6G6BY40_9FLAO|nr:F0F1 ATP synthase subunit A [Blattabacterium cuenoti]QID56910.1 ATP synthase subunit A [Blattabacterium sp. (Chorisoserrata sp.)]
MLRVYNILGNLLILLCSICLSIQSKNDEKNNLPSKLDISHIIIEHVGDSHEWKVTENRSISLPIILIKKWKGIEFFCSSKFYNNEVVKGRYGYYKMLNDKIYEVNSIGDRFKKRIIIDISITKNVLSDFISFFILIYLFVRMKHQYKNGRMKWNFGILLEQIIVFLRNEIAIPYIGKKEYHPYFPFLLTLFFFILINNLMGIIPLFPNVTGNINITFSLSLFTFFVTLFSGNKSYWKHTLWMPKVPIPVKLLLSPIELIGILIRPLTMSIRLFANITAGHIIILSFICIIFIFKNIFIAGFSVMFGLFISILEVMVSFLQSFIFTTLSALFIGISIKKYHEKKIIKKL